MTELTPPERWANVLACAEAENKKMLQRYQRPPNWGEMHNNQRKRGGGPIMSEVRRSKVGLEMLKLAEQGFTVAEVSRFTATPVEVVLRRADRLRIKFSGAPPWQIIP